MDLGDIGSGCDDGNCGLTSGLLEDCSNTECQREDEPWFGLSELVCVTVIYIPLMLLGLLGNILTILVVCLRPHMRSSSYLYLSSMAVSDLLILLLLPLDLYKLWRPRPWPLGDLACKLTVFLSECCTFSTILHITFLSLERYLAVCWPITAKTLVTRRRTRVLIVCLWLVATVSAAPVLVMVGVEDVDGDEVGFEDWREDVGWTGGEDGQGAIIPGGQEEEHGWAGIEPMKWEEKGQMGRNERPEETGRIHERKETDVIKDEDKIKADEEEDEDGNKEEQQNKMKDDEGGGRAEGVGERTETVPDRRECRCTRFAVSSGLMSAMMILSNIYFLVPFCVLGLVYSLIGRTLWLRPQNSRRDQNHRHTVKMLGVIVLAFVLCWLPFHVGRTIFFSLSVGTFTDQQESRVGTNTPLDTTTVSDVMPDYSDDANTHYSDTDTSKATYSPVASHTRGPHTPDPYTHIHPQNVDGLTDTQNHTKHSDDRNNPLNKTTGRRPHSTAGTHTFPPPPSGPRIDNTDTLFNETHADAASHLYFLYYLSQYFNLVSSVLFYLSAAINPLLYNVMSARYRHAVCGLIRKRPRAQSQRLRTFTVQHSTTTL